MNLALISTAQDESPLRVGDWQVDARANEIWRGAEKVRLEPKIMRVLCFLAERPGRVVSRESWRPLPGRARW